ncbi:FIG00639481: hypothetical protein [Escherichia coli ISC7]|uniref:Uncharacterized protein n=1 Tax=Escherichia coli ISC7 TaxID=1432555 RepID=W1EWF0_ECOLX|nr:FIG00639481: hypothetical protein [Escherichia coli ISC7]
MATDADYDTENWFERAKPERSVRCSMCFTAFLASIIYTKSDLIY